MTILIKIRYGVLDDRDRLDIIAHRVNTLSTLDSKEPIIQELFIAYADLLRKMGAAVTKSRSDELTKEIQRLDKLRKTIVEDIKKGLSYFITPDDPKKQTLSAAIAQFLTSLENTKTLAAQEKIAMAGKITLLVTTQTSLDALTLERAENEEMDDTSLVSEMRAEMHQLGRTLEKVLTFKQMIGKSEYEELAHKLNGRIGEILATAKSRHTLEVHDKEEMEEDMLLAEESVDSELLEDLEEIHEELHEDSLEGEV